MSREYGEYPYEVIFKVNQTEESEVFKELEEDRYYGGNPRKEISHTYNTRITFDELGMIQKVLKAIALRHSKKKNKRRR